MKLPGARGKASPAAPAGRTRYRATFDSAILAAMSLPSLETLADATVLFVFAHPADETVGLGGILDRFCEPWFACLSDGAPDDPAPARAAGCATPIDYARLRRRELAIALALAGHDSDRLIALGFTDQELAHSLEGITQAVEVLLQRVQPDYVITHPYEGGHPDHDATAFAVHTAVAAHDGHGSTPRILEMTGYHGRGGRRIWGEFLPDAASEELAMELSAHQRAQKRRLLSVHRSQAASLGEVPVERELLRVAPRYDFSHPPHEGPLLYETSAAPITGEQWRHAASLALERLHLSSLAASAY